MDKDNLFLYHRPLKWVFNLFLHLWERMIAMTNDCKRDGRRLGVGVGGIGQGGRRGDGERSYFQTLKSEQYENWNTIWHQITHSDIHQNTQFSHSISLLSAWLAFKLEITSWCGNTSGRRESPTPICFYCWGHNREKKRMVRCEMIHYSG